MNIFYPNLNGGKAQYAGRGYGSYPPAAEPKTKAGLPHKWGQLSGESLSEKAHSASVATGHPGAVKAAASALESANKGEHHKAFIRHYAAAFDHHEHLEANQSKNPELAEKHRVAVDAHMAAANHFEGMGGGVPNTGFAKTQAHKDAAERSQYADGEAHVPGQAEKTLHKWGALAGETLSEAAHRATQKVYGNPRHRVPWASTQAFEASRSGKHKLAAEHHEDAAVGHEEEAEKDPVRRENHLVAAMLHRHASEMQTKIATSNRNK